MKASNKYKWLMMLPMLAGLSLALTGCYYDKEEEIYGKPSTCDTVDVSFANDIKPIVQGNCAISGCHVSGGAGNGIFDGYAGIKEKADNGALHERVVVRKDMPPSGPLTECQINMIEAWINAGAKDN